MTVPHCMILYKSAPQLSADSVERHLREHGAGLAPPSKVTFEDGTLSVVWDDDREFVVATIVEAPVPAEDVEHFCARSGVWEDAPSLLQGHGSHVLMAASSEDGAVEAMRLLTRVTGAVAATAPALGVLWARARHALPARLFADFTPEMLHEETLLCHVWVNFQVGWSEDGKSNGCTTGLDALDLMDLEATDVPEDPATLRSRLHDIVTYLLRNGPVIKDGDSLGRDEHERIRAVYADSMYGADGRVIRLEYETAQPKPKRWWNRLH